MRKVVALSLWVLSLTGCDRGAQRAAPAATEAREAAARDACLAEALLVRAEENLVALQEWGLEDGGETGITTAAGGFARAYYQHAQLRHAALARVDSAMNHARTPADSARHMQGAEAFLPRGFEAGTVEANVAAAWAREYESLRTDEDHRCNWDI